MISELLSFVIVSNAPDIGEQDASHTLMVIAAWSVLPNDAISKHSAMKSTKKEMERIDRLPHVYSMISDIYII